jgi:hypothetical protein
MNNKVKLAIAVAVGIVGGGLIGTLGGTKPSGVVTASLASGMEFPEWTRNGSAFRCKDGKVQGCKVEQIVELLEELELLNLLQYVRSVLVGLIWMIF